MDGWTDALARYTPTCTQSTGIVFHSVLIGIGLGVIQTELSEVKTLLIAICVHQFFEGYVT